MVRIASQVQFADFAKVVTRAALLDCLEHFAAAAFDLTKIEPQHGRPAAQKVIP